MNRRTFLQNATALAGIFAGENVAGLGSSWASAIGTVRPFNFDQLTERARALAARTYQAPYQPNPDLVQQLGYEEVGKIHFLPEHALFSGNGITGDQQGYPLEFFHLGKFFPKRVRMHVVQQGKATEVPYDAGLFSKPEDSPARKLSADAGFRLQEWHSADDWKTQDWVAFLGASYFRTIGGDGQYGLSSRGVVIDAAVPDRSEEFPDFTEFYIEEGAVPKDPVVVHALLDGPSLTGAYRFSMVRGLDRSRGVVMEVEARLFLRKGIARLGLTPMTSMFWFGEYGRHRLDDWRPEVHDSDGLALWTSVGERIWRPLNNPEKIRISAFEDDSPQGFGLLQRDRDFDHYRDGVMYDRRPCLWVEPLKPLGKGAVQLLEIPTDDEIHDNIGVFWVPEKPATAGETLHLHYRLHWLNEEPYPAENVAQVVATRIGRGGQPGKERPKGVFKFAVEFSRPEVLKQIPFGVFPEAVVTTSKGKITRTLVEPVPNGNTWRAVFDLTLPENELSELRLYLRLDGKPLTETWACQFAPATVSFTN